MNTQGRLLVVDWDYFFPNPNLKPEFTDDLFFYDWQHNESPFMIGPIWQSRAEDFMRQNRDLPRAEGYSGFWDRFGFDGVMGVYACESNVEAARIVPEDGWGFEEVWLYDAHHDCGYRDTPARHARGEYDCGAWMLEHADRGSALHVRYPRWRADENGVLADVEPPPMTEVDRRVDSWPGEGDDPIRGDWDAVLLCRSGAWVPSWCDDQFEEFLSQLEDVTGWDATWLGEEKIPRGPREQIDMDQARTVIQMQQKLIDDLAKG